MTVLALLGIALALTAPAHATDGSRVRLRGTMPPELARMTYLGEAPGGLRLEHVVVSLGLRDRAGLDAFIAAQQDRRSPRYRHWLDAAEIADRFGPRRADYERVRAWFTGQGFTVVRDSPHRVALVVAGSAAQAQRALGTRIGRFQRAGQIYHGPLAEPALPAGVAAHVRALLGLDDLPRIHPLVVLDGGRTALGPAELATAYGAAPLRAAGLTGAGGTIAVLARSNFRDADVLAFRERFVGAPPNFVRTLVHPDRDPGILTAPGEEIEVLLDTQWAGALAPGVVVNVVIGSPAGGIPGALQAAVEERAGDLISISFGLCEPRGQQVVEFFDAYYAIANAQGQTVLVASGDRGSRTCDSITTRPTVNGLAASPHAVAVGGTSFALAPDGTLSGEPAEAVWNDASGAGGGGPSALFALPGYQRTAGLLPLGMARLLPDVALAASPRTPGYVVVRAGQDLVIGGTSASAPSFASLLALVGERLATREGTRALGQLLPALYRLGAEAAAGGAPAAFRDVTEGDIGDFAAGPAFDLATGWGAPLADQLAERVTAPGLCEPPIACLVPARAPAARACVAEWLVEQSVFRTTRRGIPRAAQTCFDGDPQCDRDGAPDGACTVNVALCVNVNDFRRLDAKRRIACNPGIVRRVRLRRPGAKLTDPDSVANRGALRAAFDTLPLPTALQSACTPTATVRVPVGGTDGRGRTLFDAVVVDRGGPVLARLALSCLGS